MRYVCVNVTSFYISYLYHTIRRWDGSNIVAIVAVIMVVAIVVIVVVVLNMRVCHLLYFSKWICGRLLKAYTVISYNIARIEGIVIGKH